MSLLASFSKPHFDRFVFREPIARANGCAVVRTYTGHGINDLFHTSPNIPHYAKNKAVGTMKAGMVRETIAVFDVDLIIRT